jgi:hypothetical protein
MNVRGAVLLDRHDPSRRVLADIAQLAALERVSWRERNARLRASGVPLASRQYFNEVIAPVMTSDASAITGTSEALMWPASPWSPVAANTLQVGQALRIMAGGVMTTPASSPGTMTLTPRFGTSTSGTSLGASVASPTLITSLTNVPWSLYAVFVCRTIGATGTGVISGHFECQSVGPAPGGSLNFGGPSTTIDTTAAAGLVFGATMGSASDSLTTRYVVVEALN